MKENRKSGGSFVIPLLLFIFSAIIATLLIIYAFVMWLAELTGSVAVAGLITGGFFIVLSALIYFLSVRRELEEILDRLDTVYEVASRIKEAYAWLSEFSFFSLFRRHK
ncbi:hypothetical protein [Alistipes sp.]|uniref:hypothetical protein n=1 Tax=Alistipes sp. TaxID=1872444 RepID=UPI003AF181C6